MFSTESNADRNLDQFEKKAFIMGFYLLNLDNRLLPHVVEEEMTNVLAFEKVFDYFSAIVNLNYIEYVTLLKDKEFKSQE